jgi:hypothetical protein
MTVMEVRPYFLPALRIAIIARKRFAQPPRVS